MELTLGFSPCPNDTFIFDALIHGKIDTEGLRFKVYYDDVETLNQKALGAELDITKLSFHAFGYVANQYALLDAGSALGFGVGPLLICRKERAVEIQERINKQDNSLRLAIPGKLTTANFLLSIAYPWMKNKQELVFSAIEDALQGNSVDLGLIIHENRFTYPNKGLLKIMDLGSYWESFSGCAIPLGGIVVNRKLPIDLQLKINRLLRKSVEFAFENPKSGIDFIRSHAQAMDEEVMYQHIALYVNEYSVHLGETGRKAIDTLFKQAEIHQILPPIHQKLYLT
jgi:1,4-dihydroxy-6-naphthoate synthase